MFKYLNALVRDLEIVVKLLPTLGLESSVKVTAARSKSGFYLQQDLIYLRVQ